MSWGGVIMNALWGLVGSLIGVIGTLGFSIWSDKKGYNRIAEKIGELNNTTLSGQHNEISSLIKNVKEDVKDTIIDRAEYSDRYTRDLYSKVDRITTIMDKNEVRYEHLNIDQKEVRNNVIKLVNSWESLINENRELKELVKELKKENEVIKTILREQSRELRRHQEYDEWELER